MSLLSLLSRRPLVTLGAAAGLWWLWPGGDPASPPPPARVQAAVIADGFAVTDGRGRIAVLEDDAERRREIAVVSPPEGARVVGAGGHTALVFRAGKQMAISVVGDDGRLGPAEKFGKRVASVCEGVASNEHRFGVAWVEADGAIWFVHGPTGRQGRAAAIADATAATTADGAPLRAAKSDSCAIASASDHIALLWTEGSRTTLTLCGKRCGDPRRVELPKRSTVLGLGCARAGCAIATRGPDGNLSATWATPQGKVVWTKPLPHAAPDTAVSLAGTAAQVAIAYATATEPVVVAASSNGGLATVWQGAADGVPGLAHAGSALLVARSTDGALGGSVVRVP